MRIYTVYLLSVDRKSVKDDKDIPSKRAGNIAAGVC